MLRKAAVRLCLSTFTSLEFYLTCRIEDLLDIAEEVKAVNEKDG